MARDSDKPEDSDRQFPAPADSNDENRESRRAQFGDSLRHIYDDVLSEPIPDSIQELLRKLG